ncbi:UDP-2-acetamido-2,6-beta-L-arabino-hexul-4-ose reductase [Azohydromonas lata]|uniref:Capsular polysaccharide biosynthesis protein CapF n=1 Tax=Azohydromonas lata TaxID=45677 RepID=A0ABU5IBP5_9BURK|nr:capsular polysaccharide biosynthesis protein CapF [Azohydromonas lata]MDZ5456522.1 capsular polysaccharide biosynthesis protein CapF [Azohydromonas lata]
MSTPQRIVITGAAGFMGRNLSLRLRELGHAEIVAVTRETPAQALQQALASADFVFHLAGVNRPQDPAEFASGNAGFTARLCELLVASGRRTPVAFASSTQAALDNAYGASKREAEEALLAYGHDSGAAVYVLRLTNVFGKWARPNYNSAVATFCHNVARGLPITVNDPAAPLKLLYIDDVVDALVRLLEGTTPAGRVEPGPVYDTTVGELAQTVRGFADSRGSLMTDRVGTGLTRALYSTYVSCLPPESFAYEVPRHGDARGVFVEMLKTPDCGQFSYFTAHPGVTRGGHYHHSKTEKFLVIKGTARFGFRHVDTQQTHELVTRGGEVRIVETVPGWTHDITNIGDEELIVMLWANEVFDRARPDTIAMKVQP